MGVDVSMDQIASKVFDNFKKITPALLSGAILSGLLLFLPKSILQKMALDHLPDLVKMILGIIFLLCSTLIVTIVLFSFFSKQYIKHKQKRFRKLQRKKYMKLSDKQKSTIKKMLNSSNKTIRLNANSGDTIYLKSTLFIHQPQQLLSPEFGDEMILTYVPEPWLLDLYNEEPELFK